MWVEPMSNSIVLKQKGEQQQKLADVSWGGAALQILNDTWQNMPEYANHLKKIVFYSVTMRDTF